jgi:hypothetical protein
VTLLRGSVSDFYPYPFIDVGELGYPHVLANATLLVLAFLTLMAVFIAINHRRPDLAIPDAAEQEEQEDQARDEH